tara:strand:- start:641 stop:1528 length:888 start_codon:yes stop_codon:yes gene_type:complete
MSEFKAQLLQYQNFLHQIRDFFYSRGVTEVKTAALLSNPVSDVYIDSICATVNREIGELKSLYLHTSPEIEMKKLLARGSGDIYQICSVYRDNEQGNQNFNEFTMLEYYRLDFDIHKLIDEITELLVKLGWRHNIRRISYNEAFIKYAGIDILQADFDSLKSIAKSHGLSTEFDWIEDLQMLLFIHLIEPQIKNYSACFVYDYPKQQSALAQIDSQVAKRFELYLNGVEIANGYQELQSAKDYRHRFSNELAKRKQLSKSISSIDEQFLLELKEGLPFCSGVAIGIERLFSSIGL